MGERKPLVPFLLAIVRKIKQKFYDEKNLK